MNPEIYFALILTAVSLFVLLGTIRLLWPGRHVLALSFFAFATACLLFSTLYWLAYDLLRPKTRMPFAANEICEWALFLLLAQSLRTSVPARIGQAKAAVPAALFAAANTALWIAWSGEWVQDILTGLSLGWFLWVLIACMLAARVLSRIEWIGFGCAAVLLIAAQTMTLIAPASAKILNIICAVLIFAVGAGLMLKALLAVIKRRSPGQGLCLSFAVYAWSEIAMYMSEGPVYIAALIMAALGYLLMFWTIGKEVAAA